MRRLPRMSATFALRPETFPWSEGNYSMYSVEADPGSIESYEDLRRIVAKTKSLRSIVVVHRSLLAQTMPAHVAADLQSPLDEEPSENFDWRYDRWNSVGGQDIENAIPHTHPTGNFHVSLQPSNTPTAFFHPRVAIQTLEAAMASAEIREGTRAAIERALFGHTRIDHALASVNHALRTSFDPEGAATLVQQWQQLIRQNKGEHTVSLQEHAAVAIPQECLHGRSTIHGIGRPFATAWRYYSLYGRG